MTATQHASDERADQPHPLLRGASPATVRAWLLPEDRNAFVAAYEHALDEARRSLDLAAVHDVVEYWRRRAVLQTDPVAYRETVRRVAELATGEARPVDEPFEVTRAKSGL